MKGNGIMCGITGNSNKSEIEFLDEQKQEILDKKAQEIEILIELHDKTKNMK